MKSQLFIPKKCKVGFNIRQDCYTKKLGYVIAFDGKKWRKENSWESWRQKSGDKKNGYYCSVKNQWVEDKGKHGDEVNPVEFDNVPTSGFVLNKKVGGYSSGWNARKTYSRVYDPRGFEFEINVANLLYILEHSNCMKGKGLEGEFIYSWDGKDLVLLPSDSPEFKAANNFTDLQSLKVSVKDLVPGLIYKSKKEEEFIYLGKFPWYSSRYDGRKGYREASKKHIFFYNSEYKGYGEADFVIKNSLDFLACKISDDLSPKYASLIEKLKNDIRVNKIISHRLEPIKLEEPTELTSKDYYGLKLKIDSFYTEFDGKVIQNSLNIEKSYAGTISGYRIDGYHTKQSCFFDFKDQQFSYIERDYLTYSGGYPGRGYMQDNRNFYHIGELKSLKANKLYVTLENGNEIEVENLDEL